MNRKMDTKLQIFSKSLRQFWGLGPWNPFLGPSTPLMSYSKAGSIQKLREVIARAVVLALAQEVAVLVLSAHEVGHGSWEGGRDK